MGHDNHDFGSLIAEVEGRADLQRLRIPDDWSQGRSTFGGLAAALLFRATRLRVKDDRPARSALVSFVGPVAPGEVEIHTELLRHGKAVTHLQARMIQDGSVRCLVQAAFGKDRASGIEVPCSPRPAAEGPEGLVDLPYIEGLTPTFTSHLQYRWALGGFPFTGSTIAELGGWCRFRERVTRWGEERILALADAWPPAVSPMMAAPAPASSLSWSLEFVCGAHTIDEEEDPDGWWFYQAKVDRAAGGYAHSRATLYSPAGQLAALSRQTVAIFS